MKQITILKKKPLSILSDYELFDIYKGVFDIGTEFIMQVIRMDKALFVKNTKAIIPTLFSGLIDLLQIYQSVGFVDSDDNSIEEISTINPILTTSEKFLTNNKYSFIYKYKTRINGLFIDISRLLVSCYMLNTKNILKHQYYTNSLENLVNLIDNENIFEYLSDLGFKKLKIDDKIFFYIISSDIKIYTEVYLFLYSLEYRTFYELYDSSVPESPIDIVIEKVQTLNEEFMKFSKIMGMSFSSDMDVLVNLFFSSLRGIFIDFMLGKKIKKPIFIEKVFLEEFQRKIVHDFLLRMFFIKKYGFDEYEGTGITKIEARRGLYYKGNIYGDLFFMDILDPDQIAILEKNMSRERVRHGKTYKIYSKLRNTSSPLRIKELLDELMTYVKSCDIDVDPNDFCRDDDAMPVICPHLVVYYTNYRAETKIVEDLMEKFIIHIGNITICKICGEEIESSSDFMLEYDEFSKNYVAGIDQIEKEYIKSEARMILSRLIRNVKITNFGRLVDDIAIIVYRKLGDIFYDIERKRTFTPEIIKDHKQLYTAIYVYVVIFKLSNAFAESGSKPALSTVYTGVKLKDAYPGILRDINSNYSSIIDAYKSTFGGKNIESIFLNAYKQITFDMSVLSKSGVLVETTIGKSVFITTIEKYPLSDFLIRKCQEVLKKYYYHNLSLEKVYIGNKLNPVFASFNDPEITRIEHENQTNYLISHFRSVSWAPVVNDKRTFSQLNDDKNISANMGFDKDKKSLHVHKFDVKIEGPTINIKCKICDLILDDILKVKPDKILEVRNKKVEITEFYKKYSIVCPLPSKDQMLEGNLFHQFVTTPTKGSYDIFTVQRKGGAVSVQCKNCGYIKGDESEEYMKKFKKPPETIEPPEDIEKFNIIPKPPTNVLEWEFNPKIFLDVSGTQGISNTITPQWLSNIGNEIFITREEMNQVQQKEFPRKFVVLGHIFEVYFMVNELKSPIQSEHVKEFFQKISTEGNQRIEEYKNITFPEENNPITLNTYQIFIDNPLYFIDFLMKMFMFLPVEVRIYVLERLHRKIIGITRYSDEEIQSIRAEVGIQHDEVIDDYDNPQQVYEDIFDEVDYDGENDEYDT